jgi:hypothetical protein
MPKEKGKKEDGTQNGKKNNMRRKQTECYSVIRLDEFFLPV